MNSCEFGGIYLYFLVQDLSNFGTRAKIVNKQCLQWTMFSEINELWHFETKFTIYYLKSNHENTIYVEQYICILFQIDRQSGAKWHKLSVIYLGKYMHSIPDWKTIVVKMVYGQFKLKTMNRNI